MPITVNLPNGSKAVFPDGTSPDVMKAAIQKKFPPTGASAGSAQPPAGAVPGSREYADWAAQQARAGKTLPQISKTEPGRTGLADQIVAGYTGAVDAVPIAGPFLKSGLEQAKAAMYGTTAEKIAADDKAREEANPVATTVGGVAGTVLPFIAGGAIPGVGRLLGMTGGLGSRIGFGALSGAAINGADTLARGGDNTDVSQSAAIGGAVGGALPILGAGLRRLVTPLPMSAAQRGAAATMDREGVTLSAGQRSGSKKLRYIESELGGSAADNLQEQQGRQFTRAALARAGIAADSAEPQVIDQGFRQLGHQFDTLAARNTLLPDRQLLADLSNVWRDYAGVTGQSQRAPIIANTLRDIAERAQVSPSVGPGAQSRAIDGAFYKSLRSRLDRAARSTKDPELMMSLRDIMGALDQAMERSIAASNRGDLGAWQTVRQQYKNLLVIEKAATGAGEQAASGVITPARLRSAAIGQGRRAFARGRNDFTELANAGVQTMTPLPQSGTAPRLAARGLSALPGLIGGAVGTPGGLPGMVGGALVGAALPAIAGRAVLSRAGRAALSNQMLPGLSERALLAPAALPQIVKDKKPAQITVRGGR